MPIHDYGRYQIHTLYLAAEKQLCGKDLYGKVLSLNIFKEKFNILRPF